MDITGNPASGVGVIDKAALVLDALEAGPTTLAQLVTATGLARPTVHRLAVALAHHRLVGRDIQGRFVLGGRLVELASAAGEDRLIAASGPVLLALRDAHHGPEVLIGAGVNAKVITAFLAACSGARAFHMSGKEDVPSRMRFRREGVPMGLPGLDEWHIQRTAAENVRAARAALDA